MKRVIKNIVDTIMLFAVLTGLYIITLEEYGILESLKGWLIALGVAAILALGIYLAFWE